MRNKHALGPQNQDSTRIQTSAMCTPWQILRVWPGFCATRAGDWSPKPGFRKCVPGLAPVCDRLVQDGGTHFFHSLRGWRGVVRNKHALGPQNQDSTRIHPFAKCTRWPILRVWRGSVRWQLGISPQNQDSENVHLDSHLSVTDWRRMEVRIF